MLSLSYFPVQGTGGGTAAALHPDASEIFKVHHQGLSEPRFLAGSGAKIFYLARANTNTVEIFTVHN